MNDVSPLVELRVERPAPINVGHFLETGRALAIAGRDDLELAADDLQDIRGMRKQIEERRVALKEPILRAGREIDKLFAEMDGPLAQAEALYKNAIATFDAKERTRIAAEQRAAQEAQQREQERLRKEAAAAAERAQAEADKLLKAAQAAAKKGDAEKAAALQSEAAVTQASGQATAQALTTAASTMMAPVAEAAGKADGVGVRYDWSWELQDAALIPREYLAIDETAINRVVKALKERCAIPGIKVIRKPVVSVRSK